MLLMMMTMKLQKPNASNFESVINNQFFQHLACRYKMYCFPNPYDITNLTDKNSFIKNKSHNFQTTSRLPTGAFSINIVQS